MKLVARTNILNSTGTVSKMIEPGKTFEMKDEDNALALIEAGEAETVESFAKRQKEEAAAAAKAKSDEKQSDEK